MSERTRVFWFVSKYASTPEFGFSSRLYNIASHFSYMNQKVVLITSDSNHLASYPKSKKTYNQRVINGFKYIWIKTKKYKKTASLARILSWIDFEIKLFGMKLKDLPEPDYIVVSSLSLFTIIYGLYIKRKFKCKLVFEVRDIYPLTLTELFKLKSWHPLVIVMSFLEKIAYRRSDLLVGLMPNLGDHVKNIIKSDKNVFFSPIGINLEVDNKDDKYENLRLKLDIENKFIIGYAGSMGISNALETIVKVVDELKEYDDIFFLFIGGGDYKETIKNKLKNCDNFYIGKKIEQKYVQNFLETCDLLYFSTDKTSLWNYGMSLNKVNDYMLSGKPIIASYSGFPSMINESRCGTFLPVNNSEAIIESIIYYKNLSVQDREEIGSRGRKWILENRNYTRLSSELLEFFLVN